MHIQYVTIVLDISYKFCIPQIYPDVVYMFLVCTNM
jgi:hypothetical protein